LFRRAATPSLMDPEALNGRVPVEPSPAMKPGADRPRGPAIGLFVSDALLLRTQLVGNRFETTVVAEGSLGLTMCPLWDDARPPPNVLETYESRSTPFGLESPRDRGLLAPLRPHEEVTVRRVALGIAKPVDLPARDVERLKSLLLIEDYSAGLRLTPGKKRHLTLPTVPPSSAQTHRTRHSRKWPSSSARHGINIFLYSGSCMARYTSRAAVVFAHCSSAARSSAGSEFNRVIQPSRKRACSTALSSRSNSRSECTGLSMLGAKRAGLLA
jgi:hypothetical protein